MDNGKILAQGKYEYLYQKYPQIFEKILKEISEKEKEKKIMKKKKPLP